MFILPPRLRQETLFYDPDLFLFAYIIKYYITTNIIELVFFRNKLLVLQM